MAEDPTHPSGITVKIVGIERGDRGRLCEEHDVCGTVVWRRSHISSAPNRNVL